MLDPTIISTIAIGTTIIGVATSAVLAVKLAEARALFKDEKEEGDRLAAENASLASQRDDALGAIAAVRHQLVDALVELTAFRAAEKRRQDQRVAASRSGHAKRAEARAAANGAG
jgi:hypothetical protein